MFGLTRDDVARVLAEWPETTTPDEQTIAVNNTLNHLLGYPHQASEDVWHTYITVSPHEVAQVLRRYRGEDEFDATGRGYFNRLM